MVGDPYTVGCQKAAECEINDHCPKSAKCVHENGVPKCRNVCDGVVCGRNAECRPENHVGVCQCRDGYEGNPKDKNNGCSAIPKSCKINSECTSGDSYCDLRSLSCKSACSSDLECHNSEGCFNGRCMSVCEIHSNACGMNAECFAQDHTRSK